MQNFISLITVSLKELTAVDIVLLAFNLLLFCFARPILLKIYGNTCRKELETRFKVFRSLILLIFAIILTEDLFIPIAQHSWITKIIALPLVLLAGFLVFFVAKYFIQLRFGVIRSDGEERTFSDTYKSRLITIVAGILTTLLTLVSIIQLLGFESILHASGAIGFVGVMLALTQGAWAPDIISGLIILNNEHFKDGDIIQFYDSKPMIGAVFKIKLFNTELLDPSNNHRISIRNSRIYNFTIHNLSRFASAKGLREELQFNIGYKVTEEQVSRMFEEAAGEMYRNPDIDIAGKYPIEVRATNAGDYAITWSLFYYTKNVQQLLKTRQLFRSAVIKRARESNIELATPILLNPRFEGEEQKKKDFRREKKGEKEICSYNL